MFLAFGVGCVTNRKRRGAVTVLRSDKEEAQFNTLEYCMCMAT